MVNLILSSAVITLVLTFFPNQVAAFPTNLEKNKSLTHPEMVIKKNKAIKSLKTNHTRSPKQESESERNAVDPAPCNTSEAWNFHDLIVTRSKACLNAPYARGASLKNSAATDCSGFVQFIYRGFKIDLPRSSAEQAQVGRVVTRTMDFSKLLPGDLLFFRRGRHVGHAGIYLGEGKMIHASTHRYGVIISDLRQSYYEKKFEVARRVIETKYPQ
jgi:cell wall-associated NlpC family hydrolase